MFPKNYDYFDNYSANHKFENKMEVWNFKEYYELDIYQMRVLNCYFYMIYKYGHRQTVNCISIENLIKVYNIKDAIEKRDFYKNIVNSVTEFNDVWTIEDEKSEAFTIKLFEKFEMVYDKDNKPVVYIKMTEEFKKFLLNSVDFKRCLLYNFESGMRNSNSKIKSIIFYELIMNEWDKVKQYYKNTDITIVALPLDLIVEKFHPEYAEGVVKYLKYTISTMSACSNIVAGQNRFLTDNPACSKDIELVYFSIHEKDKKW